MARKKKLNELQDARSRLYRCRFLQVIIRWKALDEIYKILHAYAPLRPQYFRIFSSIFFAFSAKIKICKTRAFSVFSERFFNRLRPKKKKKEEKEKILQMLQNSLFLNSFH